MAVGSAMGFTGRDPDSDEGVDGTSGGCALENRIPLS